MTDATPIAPDRKDRQRIVESASRSLLVEASAGTGKTHTLIDAILHRALEHGVSLARVAALTFTEKAAGELKGRLRRRLEEIAASPALPRRDRAREAVAELESAEVSTIHAFCLALLRERPFEAGLDPGFVQLDPAASLELAARVWDDWWRETLAEEPDGPLARALRDGIALGRSEEQLGTSLRQLAIDLYDNRTRLDGASLPSPRLESLLPLFTRWREELSRIAEEGGALTPDWIPRIAEFLEGLTSLTSLEDLSRAAAQFPRGSLHGASRAWNEATKRRVDKLVKERIQPFFEEKLEARLRHWPALDGTLRHLVSPDRGFLAAVEAEKRRRNAIDFDDMLLKTRDLLRRSSDARAHFRRRFALLAVDEFQDTDPIQMEIVLRLAASEGGESDWRDIVPEAGRLLVVGDPKQSIYRFRRADIETYRAATRSLDRETLRASRRSAPEILRWLNRVFGDLLREDSLRPFEIGYSPLEPWGGTSFPAGPHVVYLEPPPEWDDKRWREHEAAAVTRDIAERLERGETRAGGIAILVRANQRVAEFQEALTAIGIPTVLEGGRDFFRREETGAVLSALRALDNPHDAVSAVAALKSFLFAISDPKLAAARLSGQSVSLLAEARPPGRLGAAIDTLVALRARRHERSADETLAALYEATGAIESARASRHGLQAAANLERLAFVAGDLSAAGLPFGAVVRALAGGAGKDTGEPRAFEDGADAVRLLTMHKAKGLEFDVVYVTGLGSNPGGGGRKGPDRILFGGPGGTWGTTVAIGGSSVATPGCEELEELEAERERAEEKRLFYVAASRARHRLIVSMWRPHLKSGDARDRPSYPVGRFWPAMRQALEESLAHTLIVPPEPPAGRWRRDPPGSGDQAAALYQKDISEIEGRGPALEASRSLRLRRAGRPPAQEAPPEDRPRGEAAPGDRELATRLGSAVHQAMQAMVERGLAPDTAAQEAAAAWSLPVASAREATVLVANLAGSDLYQRAGAARRRLAETPLLFRDTEGYLVEGIADLLFEEPDGWVLVDYKTDRDLTIERDLYARQLGDYAAAVASLGGPRVREAYLLHARTGEAIPVGLGE